MAVRAFSLVFEEKVTNSIGLVCEGIKLDVPLSAGNSLEVCVKVTGWLPVTD